jgi:hypothetical protein
MGIENIIEVSASGIQNNQITLYSPQADVIKKNNGVYNVIPKRFGNVDLEVIYNNEEGHKKVIGKQTWKSNRLPKPEIEFLRKDLEKSYAKGAFEIPFYQYFTAKYPTGFPVTTPPVLTDCDIEFKIKGQLYPLKLNNGKFNKDFKTYVEKTKPGDILEITISAKTPDGISHTITEKIKFK